MRVARSRLLLRAVLLAAASGYLVWRALATRRLAGLGVGDAPLLERLALLELLLAAVALLAAGLALLALRAGPPERPTFTLRRPAPPKGR